MCSSCTCCASLSRMLCGGGGAGAASGSCDGARQAHFRPGAERPRLCSRQRSRARRSPSFAPARLRAGARTRRHQPRTADCTHDVTTALFARRGRDSVVRIQRPGSGGSDSARGVRDATLPTPPASNRGAIAHPPCPLPPHHRPELPSSRKDRTPPPPSPTNPTHRWHPRSEPGRARSPCTTHPPPQRASSSHAIPGPPQAAAAAYSVLGRQDNPAGRKGGGVAAPDLEAGAAVHAVGDALRRAAHAAGRLLGGALVEVGRARRRRRLPGALPVLVDDAVHVLHLRQPLGAVGASRRAAPPRAACAPLACISGARIFLCHRPPGQCGAASHSHGSSGGLPSPERHYAEHE